MVLPHHAHDGHDGILCFLYPVSVHELFGWNELAIGAAHAVYRECHALACVYDVHCSDATGSQKAIVGRAGISPFFGDSASAGASIERSVSSIDGGAAPRRWEGERGGPI